MSNGWVWGVVISEQSIGTRTALTPCPDSCVVGDGNAPGPGTSPGVIPLV